MSKMSIILIAVSTLACAGDPGTRPHDASVAEHQSRAGQEEETAAAHGAQYDPASTKKTTVCEQAGSQPTGSWPGKRPPCWTSETNPTAQHTEDAKIHREAAAKHRAAAAVLVQAEQQACTGVDETDRDVSPFYHHEDIVSVEPAEPPAANLSGKGPPAGAGGVTVVFRAVQGLTSERLERMINCHLARAAALGHDVPEMSYCPLVLKGVHATVSSTSDGFAVRLTADDQQTAQEVLRRARALRDPPRLGVPSNTSN